MTQFLRASLSSLGKIFKPRRKPLDPSSLMGMYLDQANQPASAAAIRASGTRQRQDGKFAQIRSRSVQRSN